MPVSLKHDPFIVVLSCSSLIIDPYNRAATALDSVGKAAADEVTLFEVRHMKAVGDLVKRENIDCDFVMTRVTDVCLYDEGAARQKTKIEKLTAAGVAGLDDVFFSDHKTAERVCRRLSTDLYPADR